MGFFKEENFGTKDTFNQFFNNSYDGIIITDTKNTILDINNAFEKITGFLKKDIINKKTFDFLKDNYASEATTRINQLLKNGFVDKCEIKFQHKSGEIKTFEINSIAINHNFQTFIITFIQDISEKNKILEQLRKAEQFSNNILSSLPGIFYMLEINPNEINLLKWNDNLKKETLMTDEELLGRNILNFFEPDEALRIRTALNKFLSKELTVLNTVLHPSFQKNKRQRYIYQIVLFEEQGKCYCLGSGIDISYKRDMERKLVESVIQTEEKERRRFASDLHDGLGPELSTIKLYIQALLDSNSKQFQKDIGSKAITLIDKAINALSDVSFNISPHILNKHGLVPAINTFIERLQIKDDLKIITKFDKLSRIGENEEIAVYRTIIELFNNSIKYASATIITLEIYDLKNKLVIQYADNGNGFDIKKTFGSEKGMGLENIKNRIESLEGKLTIESSLNNGFSANINMPYLVNHEVY